MENYLFVRVHYDKRVASLEPLGLEYLSACVKAENRTCRIHDEGINSPFFRFERIVSTIRRYGITFVGVSIISNTAHYALRLIHRLKKRLPHIKIMVGGPEVNINHHDFLLDDIDFVSYDNGLDLFREAVRHDFSVDTLRHCTGFAYRTNGKWGENPVGEPISDYGILPDRSFFYEHLHKIRVLAKGRFSVMKTSFSCPQQCKFCVSRHFNSSTYRERAVEEVINEIMELQNDKIFIIDDDFLVNKQCVTEICKLLIEKKCCKTFMIFARADSIVRCADILPLIYQAGFRDMLGVLEAVEDTTLEKYNKHSSVELNRKAVHLLREHNMICVGLFVINYDFTHKDFMNINRFIRKEKLIWVLFSILIPFKGTPVYEENKQKLYCYKYSRTGGTRMLMRPEKLPMLLFRLEFQFLYYINYPRIYLAGITGLFNRKYRNNREEMEHHGKT